MTLSLSTMWAQQERLVADMHLFVREALALGYDAIEVSHSTATAPFERLVSYLRDGALAGQGGRMWIAHPI